MFFRMIKKDLKEGKGLNVIILLFMVMVSTLASASALLLFANIRGVSKSQERCKPYNCVIYYAKVVGDSEKQEKRMEELITDMFPDAAIEHNEAMQFEYTNIYFEGVDYYKLNQQTGSRSLVIIKQPRSGNLVYDRNNEPFYLESGNIAVPYSFSTNTGLKEGDKLRYTTPTGKVYEFNISYVTRDPIGGSLDRFIVSDADYEVLSHDHPAKMAYTGFTVPGGMTDKDRQLLNSACAKDEQFGLYFNRTMMDGHKWSNEALISVLVTFFLTISSIFMVLIIFFTISFTIRSVIKKEERELGIMKALGTDSVSFRWLVAAKYIAFTAVGGVIGAILGTVVGDKLIGRFYYNISYSIGAVDYVVAVISAVLVIGLVMLFIIHSMRRINKISVMNILHGDSRFERIKHSDRFSLNRKKRMSPSLFLALSDIFGNFRRYILLFIAFTIGSIVVLINIQIRDSVISTDFLYKFYTWKQLDVVPNIDDNTYSALTDNTGRADIFVRNFGKLMKDNDIHADFEIRKIQNSRMIFEEGAESAEIDFGFDPEGLVIRKGGTYPKLINEVLMDYNTAKDHGVAIGDKVLIEYMKYTPDRLGSEKVQEEFTVTGFVDRLSVFNGSEVIMSAEFDEAVSEGWNAVGFTLDVPDSEKKAEIEKLEMLFPSQIMTDDEMIAGFLGMYDALFTFMRNLMLVVVTGVLGFLVVMYQTIFMKDEESEIALLVSSGFDDRSTKRWQFLRMMILFVVAMLLAMIFTPAVFANLLGLMFNALLGITGFAFTRGLIKSIVWIAFITCFIGIVMVIILRKIRNIEIWRIRNE